MMWNLKSHVPTERARILRSWSNNKEAFLQHQMAFSIIVLKQVMETKEKYLITAHDKLYHQIHNRKFTMTKRYFTNHLSITPRRTYLWFQDLLTVIVVLIWMVNPGIARWAVNSFKGQSACQLHNFTITTYEIRWHKAVIIHKIIH